MIRSIRRLILPCAAALAAGMATLGCADTATGPAPTAAPLTQHVTDDPPGGKLVACTKREHQHGSAIIGPRGGTLVVGDHMLIVPPGALTRETRLTGDAPEGNTAIINFQPSGLTFRKPAALLMNAEGCAISTAVPDVVYIDDDGVFREFIQAVYSRWWKMVIAPISHFSSYAILV